MAGPIAPQHHHTNLVSFGIIGGSAAAGGVAGAFIGGRGGANPWVRRVGAAVGSMQMEKWTGRTKDGEVSRGADFLAHLGGVTLADTLNKDHKVPNAVAEGVVAHLAGLVGKKVQSGDIAGSTADAVAWLRKGAEARTGATAEFYTTAADTLEHAGSAGDALLKQLAPTMGSIGGVELGGKGIRLLTGTTGFLALAAVGTGVGLLANAVREQLTGN